VGSRDPALDSALDAFLATTLAARVPPRWLAILGSGFGAPLLTEPALGFEEDGATELVALGLPPPRVAGHGAGLVVGRVNGTPVFVQTGRLHPYEGHDVRTCTALLRALVLRGVDRVVLTCAVGGIRAQPPAGAVAALRDQLALWAPTPLVGPQFVPAAALYDASLRATLQIVAAAEGMELAEVVYAYRPGPQYETPAEVDALGRLGADVVGMSVTYEALEAAAAGARVCGLAVVTNRAGTSGSDHGEVQRRSAAARARVAALLAGLFAAAP
jgi:purine-nucleoside phosphorylase